MVNYAFADRYDISVLFRDLFAKRYVYFKLRVGLSYFSMVLRAFKILPSSSSLRKLIIDLFVARWEAEHYDADEAENWKDLPESFFQGLAVGLSDCPREDDHQLQEESHYIKENS